MATCWRAGVAALAFWGTSASAIDVSGNWRIAGASFSRIGSLSFTQTGETLTACLSGAGTVATGTIDGDTGEFVIFFDPDFANGLNEFGVCALGWGGAFALDGDSFAGTEAESLDCGLPGPDDRRAIDGNRTSTNVSCCGNGRIEPGEQCDNGSAGGPDCCANDCTLAPAGTFCGAIDQCHLNECDAAGACQPLPPAQCGACYRCDAVRGCVGEIRSDCAAGGSGTRLSVVQRSAGTSLNWRWREGNRAVTLAELGDPTTTTGFDVCLFAPGQSTTPHLVAALPADGSCGRASCWSRTSAGFRYRDPAGSAAGITGAAFTTDARPRSRLRIGGRYVNVALPLASEVTVQMSTRDSAPSRCWSATFTAPRVDEPGRYIATVP